MRAGGLRVLVPALLLDHRRRVESGGRASDPSPASRAPNPRCLRSSARSRGRILQTLQAAMMMTRRKPTLSPPDATTNGTHCKAKHPEHVPAHLQTSRP
jgi:hypothetical protein